MLHLDVEYPWVLAAALLALLPWFATPLRGAVYPSLALFPQDSWSSTVGWVLRIAGTAALLALLLGIAGLYRTEQTVQRIGHGAHIVLALDRSSSMDDTFAGQAPSGGEESKARAARRFLTEFVRRRAEDLIGVVSFSTQPIFVQSLNDHRAAIEAAVAALDTPALSFTNAGKGLLLALSQFENRPITGSRVIVLVSDGATVIDHRSQERLRERSQYHGVSLYWLFLHTRGDKGPFDEPTEARDDRPQVMPERHLHLFFQSLGVPYKAYDAEAAEALQQAIDDINRLENRPLVYEERLPRHDLRTICYTVALVCLALLSVAKLLEVRAWR
ncbi:MAG: vWA domain-containing protein [Gammaproteobacteria bacterium]